jgi:hypothetical protein
MTYTGGILIATALTCSIVCGQSNVLAHFNPLSAGTSGVHLYGVSMSGSYFSGGYGLGLRVLTPEVAASNIAMVQGSAVFGWAKHGQKTNASVVYSPSYVRAVNKSSYRSLNHSLAFTAGRTLNAKWNLAFSARAMISDFSQLLFARSQAADIISVPSTFEDFFGAVFTGRSSNPALNQTVLAAPLQNSPETAFVYGDRLMTSAASVSASYAHSSRSALHVGISGSRAQQFRSGSTLTEETPRFVVPNTTGASVNVGWSYLLTPRTTLGVSGSTSRTLSRYQDAYTNRANVSVVRSMSRNWFVHGMIGIGTITPVHTVFAPVRKPQLQFGGGLGYKLYSHAFLGSFNRAVSDVYGLGASSTDASSGAWTWKRPGATISVSASIGYSKLNGTMFSKTESWTARAGLGKALTAHLAITAGATYTQFPKVLFASTVNEVMTQTGVVVSLSWSPSPRR